jgi:DNA primase
MILCEGPEDGLTIAQEMPGRSVWVALGTAMMPELHIPEGVSSLVIAGQNDSPGRAAVQAAAEALAERGLSVRTMYPEPAFKDWNDMLRGVRL